MSTTKITVDPSLMSRRISMLLSCTIDTFSRRYHTTMVAAVIWAQAGISS